MSEFAVPIGLSGDEMLDRVKGMDPTAVDVTLSGILMVTQLHEAIGRPVDSEAEEKPFGDQFMEHITADERDIAIGKPRTPESPAPTRSGGKFDDGGTGPGEES